MDQDALSTATASAAECPDSTDLQKHTAHCGTTTTSATAAVIQQLQLQLQ